MYNIPIWGPHTFFLGSFCCGNKKEKVRNQLGGKLTLVIVQFATKRKLHVLVWRKILKEVLVGY
jgi:hypothetical protein